MYAIRSYYANIPSKISFTISLRKGEDKTDVPAINYNPVDANAIQATKNLLNNLGRIAYSPQFRNNFV